MLIDVNDRTKDEIHDHLLKVVGKTRYSIYLKIDIEAIYFSSF